MPNLNALVDFLLGSGAFRGLGFGRLSNFDWKISPVLRERYPRLPSGDGYAANVALRLAFAGDWNTACRVDRLALSSLIIRDFGRVQGNKVATIAAHAENADRDEPATPINGIASLSKLLAMKRINRFAILDARVGVALTAVAMIARPEKAILLPYLPSQNRRIVAFRRANPTAGLLEANQGWMVADNATAYSQYIDLLKQAAGIVSRPLYAIEMALFSQSLDLCERTRTRH
ncbi:MAG: hypothetical protein ING90_02055 [Rhodocyclaceae bacterium]|jgi:hypothetical protein|nr:hypothetical protein [Rhodocyclaceae bacterium]